MPQTKIYIRLDDDDKPYSDPNRTPPKRPKDAYAEKGDEVMFMKGPKENKIKDWSVVFLSGSGGEPLPSNLSPFAEGLPTINAKGDTGKRTVRGLRNPPAQIDFHFCIRCEVQGKGWVSSDPILVINDPTTPPVVGDGKKAEKKRKSGEDS